MEQERTYSGLISSIKKIVANNSEKVIELDTILLVGSNRNIKNIDNACNKDSDIDIIILSDVDSFQIHTLHMGVKFDISIVNQNNIINFILAAFYGSPMAGKIFSSIGQHTILIDKKKVGVSFVDIALKIYILFTRTCLPNYDVNHIFLHNLSANFGDIRKTNVSESFFAYNRVANQLFDYISKLIYPFHTSGSYRGKVFEEYLNDFQEKIHKNINEGSIFSNLLVDHYCEKFSPILQSNFKAIVYSSLIKKEILLGNITSFYFGYDNLISENTVLFLSEEEYLKIMGRIEFVSLDLSNIVPCFSKNQIDTYNAFLIILSQRYFSSNVDERKNILNAIIGQFYDNGFKTIVNNSLKAILILKSIQEVSNENVIIDLEDFHKWLLNFNIAFLPNQDYSYFPKDLQQGLLQIFQYMNDYSFLKELEIKVNYVFFGIMKALRINIENLDL